MVGCLGEALKSACSPFSDGMAFDGNRLFEHGDVSNVTAQYLHEPNERVPLTIVRARG